MRLVLNKPRNYTSYESMRFAMYRIALNMTYAQVGRLFMVSARTVSGWERDWPKPGNRRRYDPAEAAYRRLANSGIRLETQTLDAFLRGEDVPKPSLRGVYLKITKNPNRLGPTWLKRQREAKKLWKLIATRKHLEPAWSELQPRPAEADNK